MEFKAKYFYHYNVYDPNNSTCVARGNGVTDIDLSVSGTDPTVPAVGLTQLIKSIADNIVTRPFGSHPDPSWIDIDNIVKL